MSAIDCLKAMVSVDPVLAAIDRHQSALAALGIASIAVDEVAAERDGRAISPADEAA